MNEIEIYVQTLFDECKAWTEGVQSGKIVTNKYIQQMLDRQEADLKNPKYELKYDEVVRVLRFFYFVNIPINNRYERFHPLPYQVFFILCVYGMYLAGTDDRKYRYAYLFVARKNGKTSFVSILQLYGLLGDNVTDPQSLLVANSREQAAIALNILNGIIKHSPAMNKRLETQKYMIKFKDRSKNGYSKTLASDTNKLDGYNPSMALIDEPHAMGNSDIFNVIKSGTLARVNPLIILASTAGFSTSSLAYILTENGKKVLAGEMDDPTFFYQLFTIDDEDDYEDPKNWIKSNPSIGTVLKLESLKAEFSQSKNAKDQLRNFKVKNLNIFINQSDNWVEDEILKLGLIDKIDWEEYHGLDCYVGIDLSSTRDLTSISLSFNKGNKYQSKTLFFFANNPKMRLRKSGVDLSPWIEDGHIIQCTTKTIDYILLYNTVISLSKLFNIKKIYYDKFNSALLIPKLEEFGITCERFEQNTSRFNEPIKFLEKQFYENNFEFDSPTLLWNFRNTVLYSDGNGNIKFMKNKSNDSIDGAVSTAMAISGWIIGDKYGYIDPNIYK